MSIDLLERIHEVESRLSKPETSTSHATASTYLDSLKDRGEAVMSVFVMGAIWRTFLGFGIKTNTDLQTKRTTLGFPRNITAILEWSDAYEFLSDEESRKLLKSEGARKDPFPDSLIDRVRRLEEILPKSAERLRRIIDEKDSIELHGEDRRTVRRLLTKGRALLTAIEPELERLRKSSKTN